MRAAVLVAAMALPVPVMAQALRTGPDGLSVPVTADLLAGLPVQEVDTLHQSSKGEIKGHYTGALLWDLIAATTTIDDDVKPALRRVVLVTASEGHQVVYGIGDIAPDFGNAPILIGYALDGAPIPDGLRMVARAICAGRAMSRV